MNVKFCRGSSKVEEAVECYQRAANLFKMAKKWGAAGNAFCEAANLHGKAGSKHDAATNYVDAANCYKKSDPNGTSIDICLTRSLYQHLTNPNCLFIMIKFRGR